jgi:hypothetical protein
MGWLSDRILHNLQYNDGGRQSVFSTVCNLMAVLLAVVPVMELLLSGATMATLPVLAHPSSNPRRKTGWWATLSEHARRTECSDDSPWRGGNVILLKDQTKAEDGYWLWRHMVRDNDLDDARYYVWFVIQCNPMNVLHNRAVYSTFSFYCQSTFANICRLPAVGRLVEWLINGCYVLGIYVWVSFLLFGVGH